MHAPHLRVSQKSVNDSPDSAKEFYIESEWRGNELEAAFEEIVENEKVAQSELDLEESVKRDILQDKANAEEMRLQALKNVERGRGAEKFLG